MHILRSYLKPFIFNSKYIVNRFINFDSGRVGQKMSYQRNFEWKGITLGKIVKKLEEFAPTTLAEPWDNVGLLVDTMNTDPIKSVLLTNDLTEDVMSEALDNKVGMIISYHPPIFKPLKTIVAANWKERMFITCLKNNIAIYSPHTCWDVVDGGVNDWLVSAFKTFKNVKPLTASGCGRIFEIKPSITLEEAVVHIKEHIDVPNVRLAIAHQKDLDCKIKTVALCAGAGTSVLSGVEADLYLTGEMLHHDVLDATQNGINVVLCNHSNSERGFLKVFAPQLEEHIFDKSVKVFVSEYDADPLITV